MSRPSRTQKSNLPQEIKDFAWRLIAKEGPSALSLRAIARELNITAPAIYNYYPRRDDLVTQLVIDAFTSFGDAQHAALKPIPTDDPTARLLALGLAYRRWALTYPERYQLIFGASLPGYDYPPEQIMPAAARSLRALVGEVEAIRVSGRLNTEGIPDVMPGFDEMLVTWKKFGGNVDTVSLSAAILIWARVHGLVSLEISGHTPPFGTNGDALYLYELAAIRKQFVR